MFKFTSCALVLVFVAALGACQQEIPVAKIKADLDEARNACRSDVSLKTHRAKANCINAAEEALMIPYLHGNGLLLQRRLQTKRLELAIQVDNGTLAQDVAEAQLKEFYAAGAVERNAADAQLQQAAEQERLAKAAIILSAIHPASPTITTTCATYSNVTDCHTQ